MDEMLESFRRQYLQQVQPSNIRYPPSKLLVKADIQQQVHRHLFDDERNDFLPPADYQRKVLKRIILEIERELSRGYDSDEYAVSDELMATMGTLSAQPVQTQSESAQTLRTLSYFVPTTTQTIGSSQRILIHEAPNLLAAGSNVGLRTWEACLRLAYYLCTFPNLADQHARKKGIKGANVIELGAGTGLLSLICSEALAANHVVATDGLPHVVEGIRSNLELNDKNRDIRSVGSIKPALLDWTDADSLNEVLKQEGEHLEYEYVLGADITYHPELFDPLAKIIRLLKTSFPKSRVLIAATVRNEATLRQFRDVCINNHHLRVHDIQDEVWKCPPYVAQTGLFHEQAFPIIIMDIDLNQS